MFSYTFSDKMAALQPSAIREILKATSVPGMIPFAAGNPSAEAFPVEEIRRITDAGHHKLIDCHMMIMNPHRYIKRIAEAGADIIYIHPESELIPSATLELIQLEGKKTGLILNPCTSLETVKDMLPITDYVMIMAVNPGFAGREFMPYTRQKFIELDNYRKEKGLNYHLMLDGGATREVIADLYHNCNVEGFVLGKQELFFQQDDYATCIDRIRTF